MADLNARLMLAKADSQEMDDLISDYLPFIKKEAARFDSSEIDYHDRVSLGLLAFMNSVRQYQESRGNFLTYAGVSIRNRIRDEIRKAAYHNRNVVYFNESDQDGEDTQFVEAEASVRSHQRAREQSDLAEEIYELTQELAVFGISFDELAEISPRQKRSRKVCHELATAMVNSETLHQNLYRTRRLPTAHLAQQLHLSVKTVEKYRRYVIALTVILSGEYPLIRAFVPLYWEEEQ